MRITLFGATGKTGQLLLQQALAQGNAVTALVRSPARVGVQSPLLCVIEGDVADAAKVEQAIAGADAVISVLGPSGNSAEQAVSRGMKNIIAAMKKHGLQRLVVSAGAGVLDPNDEPGPLHHAIGLALRVTARPVYEEMKRVVELVRASDLDWTVVRVPMLTDGARTGSVRVGYVGKGTGARITRADMADFMLKQVTDGEYVGQAPAISN